MQTKEEMLCNAPKKPRARAPDFLPAIKKAGSSEFSGAKAVETKASGQSQEEKSKSKSKGKGKDKGKGKGRLPSTRAPAKAK